MKDAAKKVDRRFLKRPRPICSSRRHFLPHCADSMDAGAASGTRVFKVLMLGAQEVGKTSLLNKAVTNTFDTAYRETLGADLMLKDAATDDREKVTMHIWSCGGHERFLPLVQQQYPGTNGVLLMYDVTNPESLKQCMFWHNEVLRALPEVVVYLVGTKCDLVDDIRIPEEDGQAQSVAWDVPHRRVSAKTGESVEELFEALLASMANQHA